MIVMKALFDSLVRTVVPYLVGGVLTLLLGLGIKADGELKSTLTAALTLLFGTIYYAVVRVLETHVAPKFGWLLGLAKTPVYVGVAEPIAKTEVVTQVTDSTGEITVTTLSPSE